MRTVLLASLRTHARRYVAAVVAVGIGVAFVVVTAAVSSATADGLVAGLSAPYEDADVVATGVPTGQAGRLLDDAAATGATASVVGYGYEPVRLDGRLLPGLPDGGAAIGVLPTDPDLRWQTLDDGAFPSGPGEAVVDAGDAEAAGVALGDVLELGRAGTGTVEVRVVGLVDAPMSSVPGSVWVPWETLGPLRDRVYVDSVAWTGPGSPTAQAAAIHRVAPDAEVQARSEFLRERQARANDGVDAIAIVLLVFASIALVVAVLVVANTFSVLFAQRRRDVALLRCVGATRRQLLRATRVEALVVGLVSSLAGLALGTAAGHGLVALVLARFSDAPLGTPSVAPTWYATALVTGVVVTLVASWLPTRRAVRVSPLAALRPDDDTRLASSAGRVRLGLGLLAVVAGTTLLGVAVVGSSPPVMVAGGTTAFAGLLLLGPVVVPALARLVGGLVVRVLGRSAGAPVRLATGHVVRDPRRTAATTASLLVGVTLTTAVLTGLASGRGALLSELDRQHPVDGAVTATADGGPLDDALLASVRAVDGVRDAVALPGTEGRVAGLGEVTVVGADPDAVAAVSRDDAAGLRPAADEVWIPFDLADGLAQGRRIAVTVDGTTRELRVRSGEGWGTAVLVAPAVLDALDGDGPVGTGAIWARADDGADADALGRALDNLAAPAGAEVEDGLASRAYVELQLDVLTAAVVGLLGIAVLIALVGIGNTLGLSVLERAREHALLRALGLTRRQLRATLAAEAVLVAVVATLLGTAVGVAFAWVAVTTLVATVVPSAPLVLPVGQLALVVAVAAAAGLLACVLPARRAARTAPASGLAAD